MLHLSPETSYNDPAIAAYLSCRRVDFDGDFVDGEVRSDRYDESYESASVGVCDDGHVL